MRVLAIDYGDARTGIAVSDALCMLAGDTFVLKEWNPPVLADAIAQEVKARDVGTIVLGYPLNMDGSAGPRAEKSLALAALIQERTGLKPVMWDERRTTVDAHRILSQNGKKMKKHKATVDAVAAALILEAYLGTL